MKSLVVWSPLTGAFDHLKIKPLIFSPRKTILEDFARTLKVGYTVEFFLRDGKIHCRNSTPNYTDKECYLVASYRHEDMNDPGGGSILFNRMNRWEQRLFK